MAQAPTQNGMTSEPVTASCSMAGAATQNVMTTGSVIARRPQADEAISSAAKGDCFAGARSDKICVISSRVFLRHPLVFDRRSLPLVSRRLRHFVRNDGCHSGSECALRATRQSPTAQSDTASLTIVMPGYMPVVAQAKHRPQVYP